MLKPSESDLRRISFPTAGWRDTFPPQGRFTVENVCSVVFSFATCILERINEFEKQGLNRKAIVGFDTRKNMKKYCRFVCKTLDGFEVLHFSRPTPTPLNVFTMVRENASILVNLTASHNPPEYGGVEVFDGRTRSVAHEELNRCATEKLRILKEVPLNNSSIREISPPIVEYAKYIRKIVDIELARNVSAVFDAIHSTGYIFREISDVLGVNVRVIRGEPDESFGGVASPDPREEILEPLGRAVLESGADIGIAGDGDLDRAGVIDENGTFMHPNVFYPLLLWYLLENGDYRKENTCVVRTVFTTHWTDEIAGFFGIDNVVETKVGFRWVNEAIRKLESEGKNVVLAFEGSGGGRIPHSIPHKDGIAVCLKMMELAGWLKERGESLSSFLREVREKVGRLYFRSFNVRRIDFSEVKSALISEFGDRSIKVTKKDGYKFIFDDFWFCVRPSGTEPLIRVFIEAKKEHILPRIEEKLRKILGGEEL